MPLLETVFAKYRRPTFVETGTCRGCGVAVALEGGAEQVRSVELHPPLFEFSRARHEGNDRVQIVEGRSEDCLAEMIRDLDEPALFWLDAHWSDPSTGGSGRVNDRVFSPVMGELAAIAAHPIRTHTILIDDLRIFAIGGYVDKDWNPISEADLRRTIQAINPAYGFTLEPGHVPNDVLAARVP
jgi:hypothetical protein